MSKFMHGFFIHLAVVCCLMLSSAARAGVKEDTQKKKIKDRLDVYLKTFETSKNFGEWLNDIKTQVTGIDHALLSEKLSGLESEPLPKIERRGDLEFLAKSGSMVIRVEVIPTAKFAIRMNNKRLDFSETKSPAERWTLLESAMPTPQSTSLYLKLFFDEAHAQAALRHVWKGAKWLGQSTGLLAVGAGAASIVGNVDTFCETVWEKFNECNASHAKLKHRLKDYLKKRAKYRADLKRYDEAMTKVGSGKSKTTPKPPTKPKAPDLEEKEDYDEFSREINVSIGGVVGAISSYKGVAASTSQQAAQLLGSKSVCPNKGDERALTCANELTELSLEVGIELGELAKKHETSPAAAPAKTKGAVQ